MKPILSIQNEELILQRYPARENDTLQAWDSADEYLINTLAERNLDPTRPILIFNDSFGALSNWLSTRGCIYNISDSFIAQQACRENLKENAKASINYLNCRDSLPKNPQAVIIKIPKNNRLLKWQLDQIAQVVSADCDVIAGAKTKEIHTSTLRLFEQKLGETHTSLAVKKSRLIFCRPNSHRPSNPSTEQATIWSVPEYNFTLFNHVNVFAGEKLDIGARFFLEHLPQDPAAEHIIDLGCGNGVIGLQCARLNPDARVTCVDESDMAVASARENADRNLTNPDQLNAMMNNCLTGMQPETADWVVCNPPFHQQNTITDHIAWQMFCDAKHVLKMKGKLRIIGNRHLGYHVKLKRLFGNVTTIASNNKFVILEAEKRPTRTTS
ncbi:methyltransferase [Thaumasiovibrio subtropicus]|uniref:methyltransferase n=1 Tax=Thaumasiovibrio subtropicus TaxID=1891207 RepID=UPI000B34FF08|nr:methyltransferase [Thaumasiovibrio subtropicus]